MRTIDLLHEVGALAGYTIDAATGQDVTNKARALRRLNIIKSDINSRFGGKWNANYREGWLPLTPLYITGTVTLTQNSNTVTGSGTSWDSTMVGAKFLGQDTAYYKVASVTNSTTLILTQPYQGATASTQTYQIWRDEYRLYPEVHALGGFIDYQLDRVLSDTWPRNMKDSFPYQIAADLPQVHTMIGRKHASSYSTGTVSGSANSYTLTGASTLWLANVEPGFEIKVTVSGTTYYYNVKSVDSDTQITLYQQLVVAISALTTYTANGKNCMIIRFQQPTSQRIVHYWYWAKDYPVANDSDEDWMMELYPKAIENGILFFDYIDKNDVVRANTSTQVYEDAIKSMKVSDDGAMTGTRTIGYNIPPEARD